MYVVFTDGFTQPPSNLIKLGLRSRPSVSFKNPTGMVINPPTSVHLKKRDTTSATASSKTQYGPTRIIPRSEQNNK